MIEAQAQLESLKQRARAGDAAALQELRDRGFFAAKQTAETHWPLSAAQRRLWIIDQMRPGGPAYNLAEALQLDGAVDVPALHRAFSRLVGRQEALRTTFGAVGDEPRQIIAPAAPLALREIDVSGAADPAQAARELAAAEALAPFDLARGPLVRATLVRLAPERHLLLCSLHHVVSDAWSLGLIARELAEFYAAEAIGRPAELPVLRTHYRDYAVAQDQVLRGPAGAAARAYWLQQLAAPAVLELPTDFPRPAVLSAAGATVFFRLPADLVTSLERLGREQQATPFMALLAVLQLLLARHCAQDDIAVGSPVAGRERVEWEDIVGFFVNTLVLRTRVAARESFAAHLRRVRETCLGAFEHQVYPFDQLVDDLKLDRDLSRSPLFDVAMQLQEAAPEPAGLPGLRLTPFNHGQSPAKCDLAFDFARSSGEIACALTYCTDLFTAARVERMGRHFIQLARAAVSAPDQPVGLLPMIDAGERRLVVETWNAAPSLARTGRTITEVFRETVDRGPEQVALSFEATSWTYRELDARTNGLAQVLRSRGVREEARVAVLVERGLALPLALFAILKAGGVYLPLDPLHPPERLRLMLEDADVSLVICDDALRALLPDGVPVLVLGNAEAEPAVTLAAPAPRPEQAAYLIYTSGSTGVPKGVLVEHRGLVNTIADQIVRWGVRPADRILQFANPSFDGSLLEIFTALLGGATLVLARRETLMDPREFVTCLERQGVTMAVLPPSFVRSLDGMPLPLRLLFMGGEAAVPADVEHYRRTMTCVNGYGPTEVSICCSAYVVPTDASLAAGVPIGTPVAGTRTLILDDQRQPVPIGVPGEIWIGGAGVVRGYWRRPALTAERFTPDPFSPEPGARLYRTGDRGRWREDGVIEFLGRVDNQVKLRGYRIELGEIEALLAEHPGVRQVAVVRREDLPGAAFLAAYVVPAGSPAPSDDALRRHLARRLPEYMIPSAFVPLAALPHTPAGKVDRRALPRPDFAAVAENAARAPRDEVEAALAAVFAEVLRTDRVDVEAKFFHLGGNSLLAIQVVTRLRERLRIELPLLRFFEHSSVAGLAAALRADATTREPVEKASRLWARVAAMSPEEKQRRLAQKRAAAGPA